jgi:hypothetical protein
MDGLSRGSILCRPMRRSATLAYSIVPVFVLPGDSQKFAGLLRLEGPSPDPAEPPQFPRFVKFLCCI